MRVSSTTNTQLVLFVLFVIVFGLAFIRVNLRVQTTLIGYHLGKLKEQEAALLEEQSHLKMTLAKLTTKNYLDLMVKSPSYQKKNRRVIANHGL